MSKRAADSDAPVSHPTVTVSAPAKVNLVLRILDRRADGYHNLWSIMQTVSLEDQVALSLSPEFPGVRLRCDMAQLSSDESNLVHRAARAVLQHAGLEVGLDIGLTKRIPLGAGLGGGSSDAAATIIGLNRLLRLGWSQTRMAQVGQLLGSDVTFFLFAPSAVVSGSGERVEPLSLNGSRWVTLVNPGFGVETKWAYQELARTRGDVRPLTGPQSALQGQKRIDWHALAALAENDFEAPVFARHGVLRDIKKALLDQGADMALLSGSGATVFGLFKNEADACAAAGQFAGQIGIQTHVVSTCSTPLRAL